MEKVSLTSAGKHLGNSFQTVKESAWWYLWKVKLDVFKMQPFCSQASGLRTHIRHLTQVNIIQALFISMRDFKQSAYLPTDWLIKCGIIHTMKYQTAIKSNECTCMNYIYKSRGRSQEQSSVRVSQPQNNRYSGTIYDISPWNTTY